MPTHYTIDIESYIKRVNSKIMDIFRAVPHVKKITIEIIDMNKIEDVNDLAPGDSLVEDYSLPTIRRAYLGYVKGPGTPVPVEIGVNRIHSEYDENRPSPEEAATMSTNEAYYRFKRANDILRRDWLCEVVRGLEVEAADSLVTDGTSDTILRALGWMDAVSNIEPTPTENKEESSEAEKEGEDVGVEETGK